MNKTFTGNFDDVDQARAARKDMIAAGIPQEKIFVDEDQQQIKVIVPEELSPQIREVFGIHNLNEAQ